MLKVSFANLNYGDNTKLDLDIFSLNETEKDLFEKIEIIPDFQKPFNLIHAVNYLDNQK